MRWMLFLLSLFVASCAFARSLDAGVTFFGLLRQSTQPQIAYRFDNGFGWRSAKATQNYEPNRPYDYRLVPSRTLRVEARLLDNGTERARAYLVIPVQNDRRYQVNADINVQDPTRGCFGCVRPAVSVPIAGNAKERLWLWYGFNGISHPLIF
jgi:hypothetical protein